MFENFTPLIDRTVPRALKKEASLKYTIAKEGIIVHLRFPTEHRLVSVEEKTFKLFVNGSEKKLGFVQANAIEQEAAIRMATVKSSSSAWIRIAVLGKDGDSEADERYVENLRKAEIAYEATTDNEIVYHTVTFAPALFTAIFGV